MNVGKPIEMIIHNMDWPTKLLLTDPKCIKANTRTDHGIYNNYKTTDNLINPRSYCKMKTKTTHWERIESESLPEGMIA